MTPRHIAPYEPDMDIADHAEARDQVVALSTPDLMVIAAAYLRYGAHSLAVDISRPEFDVMGTADASREVVRMRTTASELERRAQTAAQGVTVREALNDPAASQEHWNVAAEWREATRIIDLPEVDEALLNFKDDCTGDNATCVVRAVLRAAHGATATVPVERPATLDEAQHAAQIGACLPNGVLFDAFGRPRTRYVRVMHDGSTLVIREADLSAYQPPHDDTPYTFGEVFLSKEEFDALPEFDGF